jgi:DNA repair protein RAD16
MSHFSWWNKNVLNPIKKFGMGSDQANESMKILKSILQRIMLRRTKVEKAEDLCLPPRLIRHRYEPLDDEENDFYEALYTQSKTKVCFLEEPRKETNIYFVCFFFPKFMGFVQEGTVLNNYAHVFDLLLRLRQAVDHPWLVLHSKETAEDKHNLFCKLCHEPADDPIVSKCHHAFCRMCAKDFVGEGASFTLLFFLIVNNYIF